jgi:hypothetical protein
MLVRDALVSGPNGGLSRLSDDQMDRLVSPSRADNSGTPPVETTEVDLQLSCRVPLGGQRPSQ